MKILLDENLPRKLVAALRGCRFLTWRAVALTTAMLCGTALSQQATPPRSNCPLIVTLASSKVPNADGQDEITIHFWNQSRKSIHGAEFRLVMLDAAGNRYPASQAYLMRGSTKPNHGDFVWYSTKSEENYFREGWTNIDGIEVHVTSVMFDDATIWKPTHGVVCKATFLNADYDLTMKIWSRQADYESNKRIEKWSREHSDNPILLPLEGHISATSEACPTSLGANVYERPDGKAKVLGGIGDGANVSINREKQTDEFYWVQGVSFGDIGLAGYVYKGCVILTK